MTGSSSASADAPAWHKFVGLALALLSTTFIGISFILKKKGLLESHEKMEKEGAETQAGEGHAYLSNWKWWTGMIMMLVGEIFNFVAYAFAPAILVTPLGALSVVISAALSGWLLNERLSLAGKVGCVQCILGAIIIVFYSPETSSTQTIPQFFFDYVFQPGFLVYFFLIAGVIAFLIFYVAPRYGHLNPLVYITICSLAGAFLVLGTQGLGSSIVWSFAHWDDDNQFKQWLFYPLLLFVPACAVFQINFLNKALNIFSTAIVTPVYYVFFTTSTIITSFVLFRGTSGAAPNAIQIITLLVGFFTIVGGVALLYEDSTRRMIPVVVDTAQAIEHVVVRTLRRGSGQHLGKPKGPKSRFKVSDSNLTGSDTNYSGTGTIDAEGGYQEESGSNVPLTTEFGDRASKEFSKSTAVVSSSEFDSPDHHAVTPHVSGDQIVSVSITHRGASDSTVDVHPAQPASSNVGLSQWSYGGLPRIPSEDGSVLPEARAPSPQVRPHTPTANPQHRSITPSSIRSGTTYPEVLPNSTLAHGIRPNGGAGSRLVSHGSAFRLPGAPQLHDERPGPPPSLADSLYEDMPLASLGLFGSLLSLRRRSSLSRADTELSSILHPSQSNVVDPEFELNPRSVSYSMGRQFGNASLRRDFTAPASILMGAGARSQLPPVAAPSDGHSGRGRSTLPPVSLLKHHNIVAAAPGEEQREKSTFASMYRDKTSLGTANTAEPRVSSSHVSNGDLSTDNAQDWTPGSNAIPVETSDTMLVDQDRTVRSSSPREPERLISSTDAEQSKN